MKLQRKHKYKAKAVEADGLKFPSKAERSYYFKLKEMKKRGLIKDFECRPKPPYVLQEKFKHPISGNIQAITYTPDFLIRMHDSSQDYIVDVKGQSTEAARLRRKMFLNRYPGKDLRWLKKTDFGWVDYFETKKRKTRKK